jgi:hypothetical protein
VEITQSHRLAEGKSKVHKHHGVQAKGESHLAKGKSEEKGLRIPTATEPVLYEKIKLICDVVTREYNSSPPLGPNRVENLDKIDRCEGCVCG